MIVAVAAGVQAGPLTSRRVGSLLYTMISILILGSGGAVPTPQRTPAASWLEIDGLGVLLDPGPGALVRLVKDAQGPGGLDAVDTVLFTHLHLDHCADLPSLLFAMHLRQLPSTRPLRLAGPRGLADYHRKLGDLYGDWIVPHRRPLEILEMDPGDRLVPDGEAGWRLGGAGEGASIAAFAAAHGEARFSRVDLGYRFVDGDGRVLVHSGDSGPNPELAAAAAGADLLVVECSLPDGSEVEGHMTPERVGRLCAEARPRRVALTHVYPETSALDLPALVGARFDGPVVVAADGDLFRIHEESRT